MSENTRYFGLCMSCRNASSCTFARDPAVPAFYCEEFEIDTTNSIVSPEKDQLLMTEHDAFDEDNKFIGLCSDCEGRMNCSFLKSEGGIWCCEEYR